LGRLLRTIVSVLVDSAYPVRADLVEACELGWDRIRRPGGWWTGPERVAIASEARAATTCGLCAQRKAAVSPYAVEGAHVTSSSLAPVVVDTVHRIVTDPGRLTERWLGEVLAGGVDDAQFVELVGVVATGVAIDTLTRAMGAVLTPLPEPEAGEPGRVLPSGVAVHSAWVPTVVPEQAEDEVAAYYRERVTNPWASSAMFIGPSPRSRRSSSRCVR
jgi:hypothetical protein